MINVSSRKKHKGTADIISLYQFKIQLFTKRNYLSVVFFTTKSGEEPLSAKYTVRHLVKENTLSNPDLVPDKDVAYYITEKGKGWVCEVKGQVVGFSIIDLLEKSVWALFVDPGYAEKGIGKELHKLMLDWYFSKLRKR